MFLGYPERAVEMMAAAQEQEPLVPINNEHLALALACLGQREDARSYAFRALEVSGSEAWWVQMLAIDAANGGEPEEAIELMEQVQTARGTGPTERCRRRMRTRSGAPMLAAGFASLLRN